MAIASVSAVPDDDGWISVEDAKYRIMQMRAQGYPVTDGDFDLIEYYDHDGYISQSNFDFLIYIINGRDTIY